MELSTIVKKQDLEPLMSTQDIADYLGVGYYCVRDYRYAGRIPPPDVRLGNRPRWKPETILNLVAQGSI